jgi:hypothetical protein
MFSSPHLTLIEMLSGSPASMDLWPSGESFYPLYI